MTTRITGMVSGLDIDSLVTAGVASYQYKLDQAKQQQQILQWKQDQYRSISSSVSDFYNKYLDPTSSDSLLMSNNWVTTSFASTNSTGTSSSAVSATAVSGSATPSNYTVNVFQLATAASAEIGNSDLMNATTITIGNNNSIPLSGSTAQERAANLSSQLSAEGVTATYSSFANNGAGGLVLSSNTMGNSSNFTCTLDSGKPTEKTTTITPGKDCIATIKNSNGESITYDGTSNNTTVDGIKYTFNSATDSGAALNPTASTINSPTSTITSTTTNGTTTYADSADKNATFTTASDGTIIETSSGKITNKINADGSISKITYTENPVTITGTSDTSTLQKKIQSFMSDYNTLLTTINGKIYETNDSSYQPLTDSQKSSMTDTQITQWNTKAQTGLLHNDSYLETLAAGMKQAMSSLMKSSGLDIEMIGIQPVQDYQSKNGTYNVDPNALQSALNGGLTKNGKTFTVADIQSLFTNMSSSTTMTQSAPGDGVLSQLKVALYNNVMESGSQFQQVAGVVGTTSEYTNEITGQLKDESTLISTLTDQLNTQENALYQKYSNMETQLSTLDSSSSLFSSGN